MYFSWRYCSTNLTHPLLSSCAPESEPRYCFSFIHASFWSCLHRARLALPVSWLGACHLQAHDKVFSFYSCNLLSQRSPFVWPRHPISSLPGQIHAMLRQGHCVSCPSPCHHNGASLLKWPTRSPLFPYSASPRNSSSLRCPLEIFFHWKQTAESLTNLSQSPVHSVLWYVLLLSMHGVPCVFFDGKVF